MHELELNQLSQRQQRYNEWKSKQEDKLIRHQEKNFEITIGTCYIPC